jgi:CRISPR type III-B/RAMP module RAMP protein Cmr1
MSLSFFDMKSLSYSITSRTPIVTGDHDHRNTELQATGILGSLRYQYWLLKAVQAWQTDPENPVYPLYSAELPSKKGPKDPAFFTALGAAGSVVQLFGGTNWKKMFRFALTDAVQGAGQPCSARADDRQAQKTSYQWKQVALTFQQDRKISFFNGTEGERIHNEVEELMSFVHQYGWLGAAPQNGLGWVRVQGQAQNQPSLPKNNPVFAAKDIVLTAQEADRLKDELMDFFSEKIDKVDQHWRKSRYKGSIKYIRQEHPPIGYEIRRWLRASSALDWKKENLFFGDKNHAGCVHVSHPVAEPNRGWRIRMRFAVRPDNTGGLTPARITPAPDAWLDQSEHLLKSI